MTIALSPLEKQLINGWQKGFPLTARPYAQIASDLGISEGDVLETLASLEARGVLSRVGAVVRANSVGASSLVAMAVPQERLDDVAALVGRYEQVNHNYEREDELNLWFVVTAACGEELDQILRKIELETGLVTLKLPLTKAYHIDLGFRI